MARRSMAGPSRAAPPMPDPLDPAEFDAPPPADPGADYRVLLDAMRQAGADGIAQQSAALVQRIEQDARQRLEWGQRMGTAVDDLQRGAGQQIGRDHVGTPVTNAELVCRLRTGQNTQPPS